MCRKSRRIRSLWPKSRVITGIRPHGQRFVQEDFIIKEKRTLIQVEPTLWDLPSDTRKEVAPVFETPSYELITEPSQLAAIFPRLLESPVLGIDTETTGLDPLTDRLRLVQIATPNLTVVVDVQTCPIQILALLFSQEREMIFHNAGFDTQFLTMAGLSWPRRIFDTMLMAQLLDAGSADGNLSRCKLDAVVDRYLGLSLPKDEQSSRWDGKLSKEQLDYAARDAAVLLLLADRLKHALHTAGLGWVAAIEHRCCPALAWLELAGLPIDAERWLAQARGEEERVRSIDTHTLTGRRQRGVKHYTIALNSPVQGTNADGLKLALAYLFEHRHEAPAARLIATVHDEIVAECPIEEAEQTSYWLTHHMREAMTEILGDAVPVKVEATIGCDWAGNEVCQF